MITSNVLVELENVSMAYEGSRDVLDGIDLCLHLGESLAIVGPSGSGKSTLLNLVGALDSPTAGRVVFDGQDLETLSDKERAHLRNRRIGFVFQDHHLLPQCTALENVLLPALAGKRRTTPDEVKRAEHLLERIGLRERAGARPGQLSGGERQRIAVVRALINRPALILADEPTGALDRANAESLTDLLVELNQEENVTLLIVTHAQNLAEKMQNVRSLVQGKLV